MTGRRPRILEGVKHKQFARASRKRIAITTLLRGEEKAGTAEGGGGRGVWGRNKACVVREPVENNDKAG